MLSNIDTLSDSLFYYSKGFGKMMMMGWGQKVKSQGHSGMLEAAVLGHVNTVSCKVLRLVLCK